MGINYVHFAFFKLKIYDILKMNNFDLENIFKILNKVELYRGIILNKVSAFEYISINIGIDNFAVNLV